MDLSQLFDPVALDKPADGFVPDESNFSHKITIHTPDNPIGNLENYKIALIGITEDRGTKIEGTGEAANRIREKLYRLSGFEKHQNIIDLGNLKKGQTLKDSYFGLAEAIKILREHNIVSVVFGGTQDNTLGILRAYQEKDTELTYLSVDSRIDLIMKETNIDAHNYLDAVVPEYAEFHISKFINLGHQIYFNNPEILEYLRLNFHDCYRLGEIKSDIKETEPVIRDATVFGIDIGAIRQCDAPAHENPSPNGLMGEEACQLARYAGISDNVEAFGIFNTNTAFDRNFQTVHLNAQIIWYFMDGVMHRYNEDPSKSTKGMKKFIVDTDKTGAEIVFYKSLKSSRWWMEIPESETPVKRPSKIIACSISDYEMACNNEIPDRWLKELHRLG